MRRYVSVGIISIILLIASFSVYSYRSQVSEAQQTLEDADFIVTKFDITGSTQEGLIAVGSAELRGETGNIDENIELNSFSLELYNDSEIITSVTIPISLEDLSGEIGFEVIIPVEEGNPSDVTSGILTNIMVGIDFILGFTGTINYTYQGITSDLEFDNILQFRLNQPVLALELIEFNIENQPVINFSLYNPFSIDLTLFGGIEVVVSGSVVGEIELSSQIFEAEWTNTKENVSLLVSNSELFNLYFEQIGAPVFLQTDLQMGFDGLFVGVSPILELNTGGFDFDVEITAIQLININPTDGGVFLVINSTITSQLPLALEILELSGTVKSNGSEVGTFFWVGNDTINLRPAIPVNVDLIGIQTSILQLSALSSAENLSFTNLTLSIFVDGVIETYSIDEI